MNYPCERLSLSPSASGKRLQDADVDIGSVAYAYISLGYGQGVARALGVLRAVKPKDRGLNLRNIFDSGRSQAVFGGPSLRT